MSRLPEADRVIIEERKLNDYLLSTEHPFGRSKARFFFDLGFRKGATGTLSEALRRHAAESTITASEETDFGSNTWCRVR